MSADLPLEGIRVLELTTAWAGPFCGRLLADLGADVIKVESRRRLDVRGPAIAPPPGVGSYPDGDPGQEPWNRSGRFHERNRNKRGIALELDEPRGKDVFLRLAAATDVVVENFAPRVLPQFGLGYEQLRAVQPRLVMVSLSGFGQSGPERNYVAYGPTVEQVSGLASLLGYRDGAPTSSGLFLPDVLGGTLAAGLIMSALRGREATGEGVYIDLAEVEVVRWLMGHLVIAAQAGRPSASERLGNRDPEFVPHGTFRCAGDDRWVAIAIRSDDEWAALATAMGQPDLAARFPTAEARRAAVDEVEAAVATWVSTLDQQSVVDRLNREGIPASPVATMDQVAASPQAQERQIFSPHPIPGTSPRLVSGGLWIRDGHRPGVRSSAPALGEHNHEVLRDVAGLTDAEIEELVAAGVVGTLPAELLP